MRFSSCLLPLGILGILLFPRTLCAQDIPLLTLSGDTVSLESARSDSQLTFLYFWSTTCSVCAREMPRIIQFFADNQDRARLLGIAWPTDPDRIRNYFQNYRGSLPTLIDVDRQAFSHFRVSATPTVVLLAPSGEVLYQGFGSIRKYRRLLHRYP